MSGEEIVPNAAARTVIGGRHGSPSVTIAFPFSKVANVDAELRGFLEEVVGLVARLAVATSDAERRAVADAARDLVDRLAPTD